MLWKCKVDTLCLSTLGNETLLNVCLREEADDKNSTGRVECGTTNWNLIRMKGRGGKKNKEKVIK